LHPAYFSVPALASEVYNLGASESDREQVRVEAWSQPEFLVELEAVYSEHVALGINPDQRHLAHLLQHEILTAHLSKLNNRLVIERYLDLEGFTDRSRINQNPEHRLTVRLLH
jgi:hypothetical protein